MSYNIVFLDEYTVNGADLFTVKQEGNYTGYDETSPEQVIDRCADADIVITNKTVLDRAVISSLPKLKLICVAATGTNNVDMDAAAELDVEVSNAVDYSTHAVAEWTLGGVLALLRQTVYYDRYVKEGGYTAASRLFNFDRPTYQLHGKTWGIVGLGNIGKRVGQLASAFGCEVVYYSRSDKNADKNYTRKSLDELLSVSDIVSVHTPLTPETLNLIDYHQLSLMKKQAIVVNPARGGIINEDGLARALNDGLIAGAAIDVYSREPMTSDNPLNSVKDKFRLLESPHLGWSTKESIDILISRVVENIKAFKQERGAASS